jgi:nucleoside-diphosphate-sugar epimerase
MDNGQPARVLVTGGAGFIGSNSVRYAQAQHPGWHVTTLDKGKAQGSRHKAQGSRHKAQ